MLIPPVALALTFLSAASTPISLPGGSSGIGFDDLVYSESLGKLLVPAGRTGRLDLVEPASLRVQDIEGFTQAEHFAGGHGEGTTSADSGAGFIFASDRNRKQLLLVEPQAKKIVSHIDLSGKPDYVRWVEPLHEVWVTEPSSKLIEYFSFGTGATGARLNRQGSISFTDGPESLIVDAARGRAYTHSWKSTTFTIDLKTHKTVSTWNNGCEGARGIALAEDKGLLFVGCEEGKVTALDVAHQGKIVGTAAAGKGLDIIAYNRKRKHVYAPGADSATLTVIAVQDDGSLHALESWPSAPDAHCVATDSQTHVYVCDPQHGQLLVFND